MFIEHIAPATQIHFLKPLEKWRILSIENLMQDSFYPGTYESFAKNFIGWRKVKN